MGINKSIRPTPSSPVSNSHLILQKSDSLQVTPTNSSQSQTVSKKPPLNSSQSDTLQVTPTHSSQSQIPSK